MEEEDQFEIERVIKHRDVNLKYSKKSAKHTLKREYLIKWRGFDNTDNTWEPFLQICQDAPEAVEEYESERKMKRMEKLKKDLEDKLFTEKSKNSFDNPEDEIELDYLPENINPSHFINILMNDDPRKRVLKSKILNQEAMNVSVDEMSVNSFETLTEKEKIAKIKANLAKNSENFNDKTDNESTITSKTCEHSELGIGDEAEDYANKKLPGDSRTETEIHPITVELNKYRESCLDRMKIFKVEPPVFDVATKKYLDNCVIYTLLNPDDRNDKQRVKSTDLAKCQKGRLMMCRWLERFMIKPHQDQVKYMESIKHRLHKMQIASENDSAQNKVTVNCMEILSRNPSKI